MTAPANEEVKGPPLQPAAVALLDAAAVRKGEDISCLCDTLRISEGFYKQLATGIRPVSTVSLDLAKAMADYVGVSLDEMYKVLRSEGGSLVPPHSTGEKRKFH